MCHNDGLLKRGQWTPREDAQVIQLYQRLGKHWYEISKQLGSRTENAVKSRFNLLVQKHQREGESEESLLRRMLCEKEGLKK